MCDGSRVDRAARILCARPDRSTDNHGRALTDTKPVRIAVAGAGLIGRRHIAQVLAARDAELAAVVDPASAAAEHAAAAGGPWHQTLESLFAADRPDGVIVATPNQAHVANGLDCVAAGVPALIEKPIADDLVSARRLVDAAEASGVPILVGHHRRHNPLMLAAKTAIDSGRLGRIVAVHGSCWLYKPDDYFDIAWRRAPGAGPVFINLIHDIDNLRWLCGDVIAVQARESNAVRDNAVEDTAVLLLEFAGGALGTVSVSDTVVAPWSWELTTGENPAYPRTDQACYQIGGSEASLSLPALELWRHPGARSWWEPIERTVLACAQADPLALQIRHFCAVIRGVEQPLVSGREGMRTLAVVEAVKQAARSGTRVRVVD